MSKQQKTKMRSATDPRYGPQSWAAGQIGRENYFFLVICVCAQVAKVLITWPLWEVRQSPINLPWVAGLPQFSFGILILISLVGVLVSPRRFGLAIHLAVVAVALLLDQVRCQPQVLWVTVLTIACVYQRAKQFAMWALVALWLWAGIHKFISPQWYRGNSLQLLHQAGIAEPAKWCYWFALLVTISEIAQGVFAVLRPAVAAITCLLLHLSIAGFMLFIQWNLSVLPWNICTAIVGAWLSLKADLWGDSLAIPKFPRATGGRWLGGSAVAALLILPAGYYTGHVRHCFSHVLYSGGLPLASISKMDGTVERLAGWDLIRVPFPHEPKAFRDYFSLTAAPGEKMHIHETRPWLRSRYYQLSHRRQPTEITRATFYAADSGVSGIGCDDQIATFELVTNGATMKRRSDESMIFSVVLRPEFFSSDLLDLVNDLPNVEEIQLLGCDVRDEDLKKITTLSKLNGIGLNQTPVTHHGLEYLSGMKRLKLIEYKGQVYDSIDQIIGPKKK